MNQYQWIDNWKQNTPGSKVTEYSDSYFLDCNDYSISVPKNSNSSTPVAIYRYGSGGYGADSSVAINYVNNNNVNQFTIFPKYGNDYNTVYKEALPIVINNNGLTNTKVSDIGYSCHYATSIKQSVQYMRDNPNAPSQTIVSIDGKNGGYDGYGLQELSRLSNDDLQVMARNGCSIVAYERTNEMNDSAQMAALQRANNAGINVAIIYGDNNHGLQRDHAVNSGVFRLTSGIGVNNSTASQYNQQVKIMENGKLRDAKYDEIAKITNKTYYGNKVNNNKNLVKLNSTKDNINNEGMVHLDENYIDYYSNRINASINNFNEHPQVGDTTYNSDIINCLNMSFSNISKNRELVLGDAKFFSTLLQSTKQSYLSLDENLTNNTNELMNSSEFASKINNINFSVSNRIIINSARYSSNINVFDYFNESNGKISYNIKDIQSYMSSSNPIMNALYNDLSDYNAINLELQSFINSSSNNLIGAEWDLLRETAKLIVEEINIEIENIRNEINQRLTVLIQIKEYLEKYESLDESKIEEVKQEIARIEEEIRRLEEAKRQQEMAKYEKV